MRLIPPRHAGYSEPDPKRQVRWGTSVLAERRVWARLSGSSQRLNMSGKSSKTLAKDARGLTLVELMIATSVFAVLMLITSAAVIFIGRQFHKGIVTARTNSVVVNLTDELSRALQLSASPPVVRHVGNIWTLCLANKEYIYEKGVVQEAGGTQVVVRRDGCENWSSGEPTAVFDNPSGFSETLLLGDNMRLSELTLNSSRQHSYDLHVKVTYAPSDNDHDLLDDPNGPNAKCRGAVSGSHFCTVAESRVTISKRL